MRVDLREARRAGLHRGVAHAPVDTRANLRREISSRRMRVAGFDRNVALEAASEQPAERAREDRSFAARLHGPGDHAPDVDLTPASRALSDQLREPARTVTGRSRRATSTRCSFSRAAASCRPPTGTPPTLTPCAITSRRAWSYR